MPENLCVFGFNGIHMYYFSVCAAVCVCVWVGTLVTLSAAVSKLLFLLHFLFFFVLRHTYLAGV